MVMISPKLTLFVFALILFTAIVIGGVSRSLRRKSRVAQDMLANIMSVVEEGLAGIRIIKAFNAESLQEKRFAKENDGYSHLMTRIFWRRDLSSPLSEFLGISVVVVLLWYGSKQVFAQDLAPETFFAFLFAFYNVISPAKSFSSAYYFIQKGMASIDRINEVLDVPNPITSKPNATPLTSFENEIHFNNVSFKYPGTDTYVLRNIDLKVQKGQIIALVGSSGSGKSTLVDLIPRFHDPDEGSILIDGVDLKDFDLYSLRDKMGIVTQEAILFNDTINSNIKFSTETISKKEIERAAEYANASQFIQESENGYQTFIGDRGVKLSGGQRQRLTIARALAKNPPILILDEATAALDSESEKLVQNALEHVMTGRTSIIIAHRLSTIMHADMIYVLKQGRVVESGTHNQLQAIDGEYNKICCLTSIQLSKSLILRAYMKKISIHIVLILLSLSYTLAQSTRPLLSVGDTIYSGLDLLPPNVGIMEPNELGRWNLSGLQAPFVNMQFVRAVCQNFSGQASVIVPQVDGSEAYMYEEDGNLWITGFNVPYNGTWLQGNCSSPLPYRVADTDTGDNEFAGTFIMNLPIDYDLLALLRPDVNFADSMRVYAKFEVTLRTDGKGQLDMSRSSYMVERQSVAQIVNSEVTSTY